MSKKEQIAVKLPDDFKDKIQANVPKMANPPPPPPKKK